MPSIACVETTGSLRVLLVLIAYHPPADHVDRLLVCLSQLPAGFQYALVVKTITLARPWRPYDQEPQCLLFNKPNLATAAVSINFARGGVLSMGSPLSL